MAEEKIKYTGIEYTGISLTHTHLRTQHPLGLLVESPGRIVAGGIGGLLGDGLRVSYGGGENWGKTFVKIFLCLSVERRRRDKINNWIVQLSKIIPDCSMENTKSGQVSRGACLCGRGGCAHSSLPANSEQQCLFLCCECACVQEGCSRAEVTSIRLLGWMWPTDVIYPARGLSQHHHQLLSCADLSLLEGQP